MTDCRSGDIKFLRGARKAEAASGDFEDAQGIQWRKSSGLGTHGVGHTFGRERRLVFLNVQMGFLIERKLI